MIELRSNAGPDSEYQVGGNRQTALLVGDNLLTFSTGAGDYWVGMMDDAAMVNARFRCVMAGGGRSPCTFRALGRIVEAGIADEGQYHLAHSHNFLVSRFDDETGLQLRAAFENNVLGLALCDMRGEQAEKGTTIKIDLPIEQCPPSVQGALSSLPYAMLADEYETMGVKRTRPLRMPYERVRHSNMHDEPYFRYEMHLKY